MRSGEKFPEQLNESERDIFGLCRDVIAWSSPPHLHHYPGVIELREAATHLYGEICKIDYVNDDRYYKVAAEAEKLQAEFIELKQNIETEQAGLEKDLAVTINIEQGMSPEVIMASIKENVKHNRGMMITKNWIPMQPNYEGDNIEIRIDMPPAPNGQCEEILVYENFPAYFLEGDAILEKISRQTFGKKFDIENYKHIDRDQYALSGSIADISIEDALNIMEKIIDLIERGRILKPEKQKEYDKAIDDAKFSLENPD